MQRVRDSRQTAETSEQVSIAVVRAIADHRGTDPVDLERPLAEVIDPEALDRLFSSRGDRASSLEIEFRYGDDRVRIGSDGQIEVVDAGGPPGFTD